MSDVEREQTQIQQNEALLREQQARERAPYEERLKLFELITEKDDMLNSHLATAREIDALALSVHEVTSLRWWRALLDMSIPAIFAGIAIAVAIWALY